MVWRNRKQRGNFLDSFLDSNQLLSVPTRVSLGLRRDIYPEPLQSNQLFCLEMDSKQLSFLRFFDTTCTSRRASAVLLGLLCAALIWQIPAQRSPACFRAEMRIFVVFPVSTTRTASHTSLRRLITGSLGQSKIHVQLLP